MSPQLAECIAALPEGRWKPDKPQIDAIRKWAGVNYLPDAQKGCRFAAPLSRHPHPPAPGRTAARRQPPTSVLHRH